MEEYLGPTQVVESDSPIIQQKARELTAGLETDSEKAVALFYYVRDGIRHNPYAPGQFLENYMATETLERGSGHCEH
ncbi:MAG: transglutaminase domain-containing protein, partial [Dehalococcoidia bacterium]|nr:transglutaminase domain-containing protein [Dehalococcoidia bacterium]